MPMLVVETVLGLPVEVGEGLRGIANIDFLYSGLCAPTAGFTVGGNVGVTDLTKQTRNVYVLFVRYFRPLLDYCIWRLDSVIDQLGLEPDSSAVSIQRPQETDLVMVVVAQENELAGAIDGTE
jgi:hypothetical protein